MIDLAFDPLAGADLHRALAALRSSGPIARCRFGGQPAFVITTRALLIAGRYPDPRDHEAPILAITMGRNQILHDPRHPSTA